MADQVLEAARANLDDPLFQHPCKRVGADVVVRLRDGRRLESRRESAAGSCQEPAGARRDLAAAKFRRTSAAGSEAQLALALRSPDLSVDEVRELSAPLRAALDTQAGEITRNAPGTTST
jgi:hypothetical protein